MLTSNDITDPTQITRDQLQALYDDSMRNLEEGQIIRGRVVKINESDVVVDIQYKSEGIIPLQEFMNESGELEVAEGDEVDVLLEQTEDDHGYMVLSKEKAQRVKVWQEIEDAYRTHSTIQGAVIERIKGGLSVDVGVRAFLPGSLVDVKPVRDLDSLLGQTLDVRVIKVNRKRENIIVSRKAVLEESYQKQRLETLTNLQEGVWVYGIIKNLTEYGAFVDLGGIDGLLHITDMSWGRLNHPSEMFQIGQKVEVLIQKLDREKERISLGYKQKMQDPWFTIIQRYPIGTKTRGRVVNLTNYGAFVELEPGVEGLVHISEMSWGKKIKKPSQAVTEGEEIEVQVLDLDQKNRRISLGLKQTGPNPWELIAEKYGTGAIIEGKIRNITEFGAFVEVENGIDGLIHISDLAWNKKVNHPSEVLKKGEVVRAVILNIDVANRRISLGLKQLTENEWDEFFKKHQVGDIVECNVVKITSFGVFVELAPGVEGLIHSSEMTRDREGQKLEVSAVLKAKILKMDVAEKKIKLSERQIHEDDERATVSEYLKDQRSSATTTMGDMVGSELAALADKVKESQARAEAAAAEQAETASPDPEAAAESEEPHTAEPTDPESEAPPADETGASPDPDPEQASEPGTREETT